MSEKNMQEFEFGLKPKTIEAYVKGMIICIILTLIPFSAVMYHLLSRPMLYVVLFVTALLQFIVQTVYFMCLSTRTQQGANQVFAFAFMLLIVLVLVGGSLWIMWSLNWKMQY